MARFKVLLFTSVLFLAFIGYQFSAEFILRNNYVWSKSVDISTVKNVQKDLINPGHSWRMVYNNGVEVSKWNYIFRYDSPATSPGDEYTWKLIETKKLAFPLSLYNNSFIYLYLLSYQIKHWRHILFVIPKLFQTLFYIRSFLRLRRSINSWVFYKIFNSFVDKVPAF